MKTSLLEKNYIVDLDKAKLRALEKQSIPQADCNRLSTQMPKQIRRS